MYILIDRSFCIYFCRVMYISGGYIILQQYVLYKKNDAHDNNICFILCHLVYTFSPSHSVYTYFTRTYVYAGNTTCKLGHSSRKRVTGHLYGIIWLWHFYVCQRSRGGLTLYGAIWKGTVASSSCIIKRFSWSGEAGACVSGRRG